MVPYTAFGATIVCPAWTAETIAAWIAAMPVAKVSPASAPSRSATAAASADVVGLSIRLYAYPGVAPVRTSPSSAASPVENAAD